MRFFKVLYFLGCPLFFSLFDHVQLSARAEDCPKNNFRPDPDRSADNLVLEESVDCGDLPYRPSSRQDFCDNFDGKLLGLAEKIVGLAGVFYDEQQELTLALTSEAYQTALSESAVVERYKTALLDTFGPTVFLSQLDEAEAETMLLSIERTVKPIPPPPLPQRERSLQDSCPVAYEQISADEMECLLYERMKILLPTFALNLDSAQFSFQDLHANFERIRNEVFKKFGEDVLVADLDEKRNKIVFYVTSKKVGKKVKRLTRKTLNVPKQQVQTIVRGPRASSIILDNGEPTLDERLRPVRGGTKIQVSQAVANDDCTIGFVAKREDDNSVGFVTASHCSNELYALDGAEAYQNQEGLDEDLIGKETSDGSSRENPNLPCDPFYNECVWSDSSFYTFENEIQCDTAIFKTNEENSNELRPNGKRQTWYSLRIDGDPLMGEKLWKVGKTTGRTRGLLKLTCIYYGQEDGIGLSCQDIIDAWDGIEPIDPPLFGRSGDSGSAVFTTLGANSRFAWIKGIYWGRDYYAEGCQDPEFYSCYDFYMSPISNVQCDHGKLRTHYNDVPEC